MAGASLPEALEHALVGVHSVGAITGAGISRESGIRTYRGRGGIYDDPEEGERTVEALSGHTLRSDPDRTWRAIGRLARQSLDARPNAAHLALVQIERSVEHFVLLTQNVDGLHQMAGSRNVIDIHGDIRRARCLGCDAARELAPERLAGIESAPLCDRCGNRLRPDAVLFGELLPQAKLQRIHDEFHFNRPDLVLVVGTTALFPYISQPVEAARATGRLTVEINPEPTLLSGCVDYSLRGAAGEWLPSIARKLSGA